MVSQCAVLEDFGLFLVLADKVRPASIYLGVKGRLLLHRFSLPAILRLWFPRSQAAPTLHKPRKRSMARTFISSVLVWFMEGRLSFT